MNLFGLGNDDAIGDNVIHERRAHGAGEAEVIDLQRAWPQREDVDAFAADITIEIDQDVDFALADGLCRGRIGLPRYIRDRIESGGKPLPHGTVVVDATVEGVNLEPALIVRLEKTRHEVGRRVGAEFARDITEADLVVTIALSTPKRLARRMVGGENLGAGFEIGRRSGNHLEGEGPAYAPALAHALLHGLCLRFEIAPIAAMQARVDEMPARIRIFGIEAQYLLIVGDRLLVALQLHGQEGSAVAVYLRGIRLQRDRSFVARQRFIVALQHFQSDSAVCVDIGGFSRSQHASASL